MTKQTIVWDRDLFEKYVRSRFPNPVDQGVAGRTMRYVAELCKQDRLSEGPRQDFRPEALKFRGTLEEGYREGKRKNDPFDRVGDGLSAAGALLNASSAGWKAKALWGVGSSVAESSIVQDGLGADQALYAARYRRGLVLDAVNLGDDIEVFIEEVMTDPYCAKQAGYALPEIADAETQVIATKAVEVIAEFADDEITVPPQVRRGIRPDGTLVVDVEKLKEVLQEDFAAWAEQTRASTTEVRAELAAMRQSQETVRDWVKTHEQEATERNRALQQAAKRTEMVRAAEPALQGAAQGLSVLTSLMRLVDPKLSADVDRIGTAVIQTARATVEVVQTAANIVSEGLTAALSAGALAATGNFVGAAAALIGAFFGSGPSVDEQILEEVKQLRADMDELHTDMIDRFDKLDAKLTQVYIDVMRAVNLIRVDERRLAEEVAVVQALLKEQQAALARVERNLELFFRIPSREELKVNMAAALGRPQRSKSPEMSRGEYEKYAGYFYIWATSTCQQDVESPVAGRSTSSAGQLQWLKSTAQDATNLGYIVKIIKQRGWPGTGSIMAGRLIPNPDSWAVAAAYSRLESEWPLLSAQANSAALNKRRNEVKANGVLLRNLLTGMVTEVDEASQNLLWHACAAVAEAVIALGIEIEAAVVRFEDKKCDVAKETGQPYLPVWTPPESKDGYDYMPRVFIKDSPGGWHPLRGAIVPPGVIARLSPLVRAKMVLDPPAWIGDLRVHRERDDRGMFTGTGLFELGILNVSGTFPILVHKFYARGDIGKPPDDVEQRIWGNDRWNREWALKLSTTDVVNLPTEWLEQNFYPQWRQDVRSWRTDRYHADVAPWLEAEFTRPGAPVAQAATDYEAAVALLDAVISLAMPTSRQHDDVIRATLDGSPASSGGVAFPDITTITGLLRTRDPQWAVTAPQAREAVLAPIVHKVTADPLSLLPPRLEQYRAAVAGKQVTARHPVVDHSVARLRLGQGIVKQARLAQRSKPVAKTTHS
jgi:hypothetical protein